MTARAASAPDLVTILCERQNQIGENDGAFARRLGVTRQAWRFTKARETRPGPRLLRGVRKAYPDLTDLTTAFLFGENG